MNHSKLVFEFHRRNYLSFGDKKTPHEDFLWHIDDMSVTPFKVYSIIFYLRKDSTIKGGNLLYKLDGKEKKIDMVAQKISAFIKTYFNCENTKLNSQHFVKASSYIELDLFLMQYKILPVKLDEYLNYISFCLLE